MSVCEYVRSGALLACLFLHAYVCGSVRVGIHMCARSGPPSSPAPPTLTRLTVRVVCCVLCAVRCLVCVVC